MNVEKQDEYAIFYIKKWINLNKDFLKKTKKIILTKKIYKENPTKLKTNLNKTKNVLESHL